MLFLHGDILLFLTLSYFIHIYNTTIRLSRHETAEYLRGTDTRPKSATSRMVQGTAEGKTVNRFAPIPDPSARKRRILSGRKSAKLRAGKLKGGNLSGSEESDTGAEIYEDDGGDNDNSNEEDDQEEVSFIDENGKKGTRTVEVGGRKVVQTILKASNQRHTKHKTNAPFRFRSVLQLTYKQEFYVELSSDSEDEGGSATGTGF